MPELTETARTARLAKTALMAAMALFFTLVVFNNIADFDSNYQFVRHVLLMDSTFPGNHGMWRALHPSALHLAFYGGIIAYEAFNMVLCWMAAAMLFIDHKSETNFVRSKKFAIRALAAGMLLWLVAFLEVGAEWFLMWQSKTWNGQEAAFHMFVIEGILLVIMLLPESGE